MKKTTQEIGFEVSLEEAMASVQVDKEAGVLKEVVLLTGEKTTKNNTFYTKAALQEAGRRYEGAKMFLDHADSEVRSVRDLGGTYRNVRLKENKVVGDLHLVNDQSVREIAYHMAEQKVGGLSIRDRGRGRKEDDVFMVEGFSKGNPFSIDLVSEPSANNNLFESAEGNDDDLEEKTQGGDDMKLSEAKLDDLQKENPALVEAIRADERAKVTKEVEEKVKNGETAQKELLLAKKLQALAEAGFPAEVSKSVRKMIEGEAITLEAAQSLIGAQKEVIAAVSKQPAGKPKVSGHGVDQDMAEGLDEKGNRPSDKISDDELKESLMA